MDRELTTNSPLIALATGIERRENMKHVLGRAVTLRCRRSDRGLEIAGDDRGILHIGTEIVGEPRGQRQGRGRRGQTESAGPSGAGTQAGTANVVGDPGTRPDAPRVGPRPAARRSWR